MVYEFSSPSGVPKSNKKQTEKSMNLLYAIFLMSFFSPTLLNPHSVPPYSIKTQQKKSFHSRDDFPPHV